MKVLMRTTAAGPRGIYLAGTIADVDAAFAEDLIEHKFATRLGGIPAEVTAIGKQESATLLHSKQKRTRGKRS